jgi:hypothetical protein
MDQQSRPFEAIVSEKLSAITFVLDYWQLHFDGPTINALSRMEVSVHGVVLRDEHDQFRNLICGQIGKLVADVVLVQSEACTIIFVDKSSIKISLKQEDYRGPEAMIFYGSNHSTWVVV